MKVGPAGEIEALDRRLWEYRDDSFLAHGLAHEPGADRQPILLTTGSENLNQAQALFLVGGAAPIDLEAFVRCVVLFDGNDEVALKEARGLWREIKAAGLTAAYYKQMERGWEKQQ